MVFLSLHKIVQCNPQLYCTAKSLTVMRDGIQAFLQSYFLQTYDLQISGKLCATFSKPFLSLSPSWGLPWSHDWSITQLTAPHIRDFGHFISRRCRISLISERVRKFRRRGSLVHFNVSMESLQLQIPKHNIYVALLVVERFFFQRSLTKFAGSFSYIFLTSRPLRKRLVRLYVNRNLRFAGA